MSRMVCWRYRAWFSVAHDCEMCRVSGYDEHGSEFWRLVPTGKGYRALRDEAVKRIMECIEEVDASGQPVNRPGEVA